MGAEPAPADRPALTDAIAMSDCMSAGPFLEVGRAQAAAAQLRDQGFTLDLRASRDEVWVGQWVRLDQLPNADAAAAALAGLRAAGLTDAYLLTEEAPGTVISLGVFSDPQRAQDIAGLARDAGYEATVGDRSARPMSPGSISIVARMRDCRRSNRCRRAPVSRRGSSCARARPRRRRPQTAHRRVTVSRLPANERGVTRVSR